MHLCLNTACSLISELRAGPGHTASQLTLLHCLWAPSWDSMCMHGTRTCQGCGYIVITQQTQGECACNTCLVKRLSLYLAHLFAQQLPCIMVHHLYPCHCTPVMAMTQSSPLGTQPYEAGRGE